MKKEKIILIIIAFLIILIICIVGLISVLEKSEDENMLAAGDEVIIDREINSKLATVENRDNFYIVQSCIEKFYTCYCEIFDEKYEGYMANTEEKKAEVKAERVEKVYKMLDEEYIEKEGITLENLASKLPETQYTSILIQNMYYAEKDQRISAYFAFGALDSKGTDLNIMVKIDFLNRTFKISLGEQVENYYEELKNGQELQIEEEQIENEIYNTFTYEYITETEYIRDLLAHYKKVVRANKEYSYELLDEDYKQICFENLDEYLSYLDSNYSKIMSANLDEYGQEEKDSYTEYTFKDTKGNYYIFRETAPFKYTVILDNYTIPTEDFKEQYDSLSDTKKVVLNIKKFFMGINDKNYGYSYSVLSESFRNNKYPTKDDFMSFVEKNFFEENEIEFVSYEKESGVYIYKIKILDATGKDTTEKEFNMIVKLNSGTNFEMSFGTD